MQLQFATDWAVRILLYLAAKGSRTSSTELSAKLGINKNSLLTIGRHMKKAGLVHVEVGPFGGYALAISPNAITIYDVMVAFDNILKLSAIENITDESALVADGFYHEVEDAMTQMLKSKTIADLLSERTA